MKMEAIYKRIIEQAVEEFKENDEYDTDILSNVIKTVCNIPVCLTIKIFKQENNEYLSQLHIYNQENSCLQTLCSMKIKINTESIKSMFDKFTTTIMSLKFNKCDSAFATENNKKWDNDNLATEEFNNALMSYLEEFKFDNITFRFEKCCVCHEITKQKIRGCNHTLCIPCYISLQKSDSCCCCSSNKKCPICREDIEEMADPFEE